MFVAQMQSGNLFLALVGVLAALVMLMVVAVSGQFLSLYLQALLSNANVGLFEIIGMRFRKVDARLVVYSRIRAVKAGIDIPTTAIENHYLAGGDVRRVISAMIAAKGANIRLPWSEATSIDLAGQDVFDAVPKGVQPEVLDRPMGR